MEWANSPWLTFAVSGLVVPLVVSGLKRWKIGLALKRVLAFVVSFLVAGTGLLLEDKMSWETILPNMGIVFMSATIVYQAFFRGPLGGLPLKAMAKLVTPGK